MSETAELVVEIHVPLTPALNQPEGEYPFSWIDGINAAIVKHEANGELEMFDDSAEWNDDYIFLVAGAPESRLLAAARHIAELPGVPLGVHAIVTDSNASGFGVGTRIDIS